jgi:hypothetical protein
MRSGTERANRRGFQAEVQIAPVRWHLRLMSLRSRRIPAGRACGYLLEGASEIAIPAEGVPRTGIANSLVGFPPPG